MTRKRNDNHSTEFGLWIREFGPDSKRDGLDLENLDYVLFNYYTGDLALVEEKRYGGKPTIAQWDTLGIVDQLLKYGSDLKRPVKTLRGWRSIKYHGLYLLRFENTTPDDGWVELNGERISKDDVIRFFNFGRKTHYRG